MRGEPTIEMVPAKVWELADSLLRELGRTHGTIVIIAKDGKATEIRNEQRALRGKSEIERN